MKRIHSLSFKIPAIISVISVALIVIILSIAVNFANIGISESRFEGFDNTVQAYAKLFDSIMISQISLAETYSVIPAVVNAIINRNEQNLSDLLNALKHINTVNDYSINTVISDLNGNVIMDAVGNTTGSMTERRPTLWNKLQSNSGKFTYDDDLVKSKDTGVYSIAIGGGVKDNDGKLIGYAFVIIDWKLIHDTYFSDIVLGESGRIFAVDSRLRNMMDTLYDQIGGTAVQAYQGAFSDNLENGKLSYTYSNENRTGSYYKMKTMNWVISMSMYDSEIYSANKQLILISSIVALAAIVLLTIFLYLFIKRLMGHLESIIKEAKEIESGNLTYASNEHKRKDEFGILFDSFRNMRKKLTEIISQVNASSEKITYAAQELANGNADLSKRTESQAASLEETASSMEEMASTIKS
uniref:methyl-accepting chemotaxis protein n=1 Tax=Brachyspira innocens TaxID=13264 RepID=UPI0026EC0674